MPNSRTGSRSRRGCLGPNLACAGPFGALLAGQAWVAAGAAIVFILAQVQAASAAVVLACLAGYPRRAFAGGAVLSHLAGVSTTPAVAKVLGEISTGGVASALRRRTGCGARRLGPGRRDSAANSSSADSMQRTPDMTFMDVRARLGFLKADNEGFAVALFYLLSKVPRPSSAWAGSFGVLILLVSAELGRPGRARAPVPTRAAVCHLLPVAAGGQQSLTGQPA